MEGPNINLDPARLRTQKIAQEEEKRFEEIVKRIIKILKEEKVTVHELPLIVSLITGKLNNKFDGADVEKILGL